MLTGSAAALLRVRREGGIGTDVWVSGVCGKNFRSTFPSGTNSARLDQVATNLLPNILKIERKIDDRT